MQARLFCSLPAMHSKECRACLRFLLRALCNQSPGSTHIHELHIYACVIKNPCYAQLSLSLLALCGHNAAYFMATANCSKETALSLQLSRPWLAWIMKSRERHQQLQHAAGSKAGRQHVAHQIKALPGLYSLFPFHIHHIHRIPFHISISFSILIFISFSACGTRTFLLAEILFFCQLIRLTNLEEVKFIKKCETLLNYLLALFKVALHFSQLPEFHCRR